MPVHMLFRMRGYVADFVKQRLHCMDNKAEEEVSRPLGDTVHGTSQARKAQSSISIPSTVGPSDPLGNDERRGVPVLVMVEDMSELG